MPRIRSSLYARAGNWLKWLVAAAILYYLFRQVDYLAFLKALRFADLAFYIPLAVVFIIVCFLIESQNLMVLFGIFGHRIPFREITLVRGATYMLMIINYNLGLGGVAWFLKKRNLMSLTRSSSVMMFYYFVESVGITFFASAGCLLIMEQSPVYPRIALIAAAMCVAYLAIFFSYRFFPDIRWLKRFTTSELLKSFREATAGGYFKLTFYRFFYFLAFILFFYFGLKSFHVSAPLLSLFGIIPVVFFLGNIPVTPFGLGTIQAAMMYFFRDYGPAENIFAFSVVYSVTLLGLRAPIGMFYWLKMRNGQGQKTMEYEVSR